jgi:hypothetical protein
MPDEHRRQPAELENYVQTTKKYVKKERSPSKIQPQP